MDTLLLFPVLWPILGAFLCVLIGQKSEKGRDLCVCVVTGIQLLASLALMGALLSGRELALTLDGALGAGLSFEGNGFGLLFACLTAYMWFMTTLFSMEYMAHSGNRNRYVFFLLLTLSGTAGVFLSGDLFTAFVCFELMSVASYVCVIHEETPEAMRAGGVYLAMAILGGLVSLMGLFVLYAYTGTLRFDELYEACGRMAADRPGWLYAAGGCILFGFGMKAGMFPLHVWLPMAHPVAPAPASALLSGIITKTGLFGVLVISTRLFAADGRWGLLLLLIGVVTALLGGVLALFSVDFKRTLACSSMSQLGFIFIGIGTMCLLGEDNATAVRGVVLHMFNHANLKLVLFMAAGVVLEHLHNGNLNHVRGFGRGKPLLCYVFLMGSLGISGIPLFNGYISKTLLHESITEVIELVEKGGGVLSFAFASGEGAVLFCRGIEWLFLLTGGMTLAYMTKLFVLLFVEKNADPQKQAAYEAMRSYCSPLTGGVLAVSATVLPLLGLFPRRTQEVLAGLGQGFLGIEADAGIGTVSYFSWDCIKGSLISIVFGILLYVLLIRGWMMAKNEDGVREYVDRWPKRLNLLTLAYEPVVMGLLPAIAAFVCRCLDYLVDGLVLLCRRTTHRQIHEQVLSPARYKLSYHLGVLCNTVALFLNRTILKGHPIRHDYVLEFSMRSKSRRAFVSVVAATASFGLFMFSIGVIIVVVYLLLV